MEIKKIEQIKTHPLFEGIFRIDEELLGRIERDMSEGRYDSSQPIILATWEGQKEPVCIDGHTRLQAAKNFGIEEVPVFTHEFDTEQESLTTPGTERCYLRARLSFGSRFQPISNSP